MEILRYTLKRIPEGKRKSDWRHDGHIIRLCVDCGDSWSVHIAFLDIASKVTLANGQEKVWPNLTWRHLSVDPYQPCTYYSHSGWGLSWPSRRVSRLSPLICSILSLILWPRQIPKYGTSLHQRRSPRSAFGISLSGLVFVEIFFADIVGRWFDYAAHYIQRVEILLRLLELGCMRWRR